MTWWQVLLPGLLGGGVFGAVAGAVATLVRLRGQVGLDAAQTRNLTEQVDDLVWRRTKEALAQADERERKLLARLAIVEEHVRGLERALRDAGLPVPVLPYGGI